MRPSTRVTAFVLGIAAGALLLVPSAADAQIRLIPQVGVYAPVSDLGTVSTVDGARAVGKRNTSFAYGLGVELGSPDGLSLRLNGIYGSDSEVPVGGVGCEGTACDIRSTVFGGSGTLVLRPIPRLVLIQPYLLAGGGVKRYDYEIEDEESLRNVFDDGLEPAGQLGVGVEWSLGVLSGTLEVSDWISGAALQADEGETQHDFFVTVGLILG